MTDQATKPKRVRKAKEVTNLPVANPYQEHIDKFQRDEHGLLKSAKYQFNEDGSVNYRAMIDNIHLYPNKDWFESKKKAVPETVEGLEDNQLLIKLSGIKEILKIRGFSHVNFDVINSSESSSVVKCTITFIPNYESSKQSLFIGGPQYSEVANATLNNCDGFSAKFLESIAANRAFIRCVRNFLGIHIVGADEIDKSKGAKHVREEEETVTSASFGPQETLRKKALEAGFDSLDSFKDKFLKECWKQEKYRNPETSTWEDFSDIPAKEARILTGLISSLSNSLSS